MQRLRTLATLLCLTALVGLPLWGVGCDGQNGYDGGNGGTADGAGSGTTSPEAGSAVGGGTDVPNGDE